MTIKYARATEADVQTAVLQVLAYHPRVAWVCRQNTGAAKLPGRGGEQLVRFGQPGQPDITGQMKDGRRLDVEVKREGWRPPRSGRELAKWELQRSWLLRTLEHGGVAGVARSVDEAIQIVNGAVPVLDRLWWVV